MSANSISLFSSPTGHAAMMDWYTRALDRANIDFEMLSVSTRYGETHLVAAGPRTAPPVVLLHGMEGNAASWRHQLAGLHNELRLYALDIVGSAGKSAPVRLSHDNHEYAEWLVDVLDALGIEQAHLVGISNGVWLILKLAACAPQRVASAVLMSPNGIMPVRFPFSLARLVDRVAVRTAKDVLAATLLTQNLVRRAVTRTYVADADLDPHEIEWFYLLAKYYHFRFPPGPVSDAELAALTAPTLLLVGELEQFFPIRKVIARARQHMPNVQTEMIAGVGHNMCTDNPALINGYIRQFVKAHADLDTPTDSQETDIAL